MSAMLGISAFKDCYSPKHQEMNSKINTHLSQGSELSPFRHSKGMKIETAVNTRLAARKRMSKIASGMVLIQKLPGLKL